jgi:hypothetical protein
MHDGISFDKILPKQVGYFGTRINWKQPKKRENSVTTLAAPRRGLFWRFLIAIKHVTNTH